MGKIWDQCSECADDSIDTMTDRPYSYNSQKDESSAAVNKKDGLRLFDKSFNVYNIGQFVVVWNFVPCKWTHDKCAEFVRANLGYQTKTPKKTQGM
jgi:hypothetical protein